MERKVRQWDGFNKVVSLIEDKMKADGWNTQTPDSYCSYLFNLSDEEIAELYKEE